MHSPISILSTKELRAETCALAVKEHCLLMIIPFIRIEYCTGDADAGTPGLQPVRAIFTSAHGVKAYTALAKEYKPLVTEVFCIAGATESMVRECLPWAEIIASRPYAAELVKDIEDKGRGQSLYFFCGDQRMPTIPEGLQRAGISYEERVVYKTFAVPEVINENFDGVLFFSPSAVHSFFSVNQLPAVSRAFAIGHTTAKALREYGVQEIGVAPRPDEQELLAYAIDTCRQIKK